MDGNRKVIMAVGAHTGDAQLTMGMLLAKHAQQGDKIIVVDLTAGERGCPAGTTPEEFRPRNVEGSWAANPSCSTFPTASCATARKSNCGWRA